MAQKRFFKDRVLTNMEKQRRHLDKVASIDKDMDLALQNIDWNRRNQAELSLSNFVETYLMDSLFEVPPSSRMRQVMQSMFDALADSKPFQVMLPRGSGKSVVAESMLLYLIATGKRKFAVIVSQSARSASLMMKDFYYILTNKESKFAQDYPHVCLPFILSHGSTRRLQMYHGRDVGIERNSTTISLPRLVDETGKEFPTFGSVITCRGVTSGLRGMRQGKIRPDVVLVDDIQKKMKKVFETPSVFIRKIVN